MGNARRNFPIKCAIAAKIRNHQSGNAQDNAPNRTRPKRNRTHSKQHPNPNPAHSTEIERDRPIDGVTLGCGVRGRTLPLGSPVTLGFARARRDAGRSKKSNHGGESVRQLLGRAVEANRAKLTEMGRENGELWKNREAGRERQRTGSCDFAAAAADLTCAAAGVDFALLPRHASLRTERGLW